MAKFCRYCGSPVGENAHFCRKCGRQLTAASPQTGTQQQKVRSAPQTTDTQMRSAPAAQPVQQRKAPARQQTQTASRPAEPKKAAAAAPSPVRQQIGTLTASAAAGEADLGELQFPQAVSAAVPEISVLSPVKGIFQSAGSFLRGVSDIFRKPSALIGTLVLAALWFALSLFRDSDSQIVRILSWITFSEGGLDRSVPGMVGGALGKGTVAAALASLFTGGLKDLIKGIGALFTGHGEKRSKASVILGLLAGAALYIAFAGADSLSGAAAMTGISGALLSLEALGGGSGKLYELARSLTSRAADGVRTAVQGRCDGLLTGLTMGFALATALTALAGTLGGLLK